MKKYAKYIIIFILATIIGFIFTKASAQTQQIEIYESDWKNATELLSHAMARNQVELGISLSDVIAAQQKQVNKRIRFKQRGSYTPVTFTTHTGRVLIIGRQGIFQSAPVTIKVVKAEAPTVKISLPMDDPIDTSYWISDLYELCTVTISR